MMGFVRWEEVALSSERGSRLIHYEVEGVDGRRYVAVVGREKSPRHLSFSAAPQFLARLGVVRRVRLKTKKEVHDWLDSVVDGGYLSCGSFSHVDRHDDKAEPSSSEEPPLKKVKYAIESFFWLGAPWICNKGRKNYKSFSRNGVVISVNDFVYVMAEQNKRLVAYVKDMYEDSKGACMVGVRWFHKIDEVGIDLPPNFNDREIFFSLCLQDISVECIDGLATVLNLEHYNQYLDSATNNTHWTPHMCHRQFDNDEIEPFDITHIQGYSDQNIFRYILRSNHELNGSIDGFKFKLKRKKGSHVLYERIQRSPALTEKKAISLDRTSQKDKNMDSNLSVGCHVEVFSQDSGVRGCWFQATIVKKKKQKLKVRYDHLEDPDNAEKLEEWISAHKGASTDKLGIRLCGRSTVRPSRPSAALSLSSLNVGLVVDAWWHDGWWEGIVIKSGDEGKLLVYFPGEGNSNLFELKYLRPSLEWLNNKWNPIAEAPHLARSVLKELHIVDDTTMIELKQVLENSLHLQSSPEPSKSHIPGESHSNPSSITLTNSVASWSNVPKKRRSCGKVINTKYTGKQCEEDRENCILSSHKLDDGTNLICERHGITIPEAPKKTMEIEVCKYGTHPLFTASMTPWSLVMSR